MLHNKVLQFRQIRRLASIRAARAKVCTAISTGRLQIMRKNSKTPSGHKHCLTKLNRY